jgi:ribosome maturation factor RimP
MSDVEVAHEYSSKCLTTITQKNNKNDCENCEKIKREHQKTLDKLRSVKLGY